MFDCLSSGGGGSLSLGLNIGADQALLEDGEQAALGLLSLSGADVDEAVDVGGCGGSCGILVRVNLDRRLSWN